jgi:hypothetical protein
LAPLPLRKVALVEMMQLVARPALDGLAEHRFGGAGRIDVGAVEHVDASVEADVDELACLGHVGAAPGAEELALAPEGAGAKTQHGDLEARFAQMTVFQSATPSRAMNEAAGRPAAVASLLAGALNPCGSGFAPIG